MTTDTLQQNAAATFDSANNCSDHPLGLDWSELEGHAIAYWDNGEDEFASIAVFGLPDGRFCVIEESSDYSGHG